MSDFITKYNLLLIAHLQSSNTQWLNFHCCTACFYRRKEFILTGFRGKSSEQKYFYVVIFGDIIAKLAHWAGHIFPRFQVVVVRVAIVLLSELLGYWVGYNWPWLIHEVVKLSGWFNLSSSWLWLAVFPLQIKYATVYFDIPVK